VNIPVNSKTIGTIISIIVLVAGLIGTWYINNARIDGLEEKVKAFEITKLPGVKKEINTEVTRVERESKERDTKIEATHKENIENINGKMDQIEDVTHSTQLAVGTISQDIKNMGENISEIKDDLKSIRNSVRRRGR